MSHAINWVLGFVVSGALTWAATAFSTTTNRFEAISVAIAQQAERIETLQADVSEMKASLATILDRLRILEIKGGG